MSTAEELAQAISEGHNVRLDGNLTLSSAVEITGETEIDLNGHSVTAGLSTPLFNVNGGNLTLKGNGNVTNNVNCGVAQNGGTITVNGGSYTSQTDSAFDALQNGTIIFNKGEATGREGGICAPAGKGHIEVNGGHLTGIDNFAIATNGRKERGDNVIVVNGGLLEGNIKSAGYEAIGVYIANKDVFVMNGGKIIAHGGTGLCMRAGDVTINGGEIVATNVDKDGNIVADGKIADDPTIMVGCSAVIYHESANYPNKADMRLEIKGGRITGIDHSVEVLSNEETPNVHVTGGVLTPAYP